MLGRGDRQHDVAAWFGVNAGRIADIAAGRSFAEVEPVHGQLPPPGPYTHVREVYAALEVAEAALAAAKKLVASYPC